MQGLSQKRIKLIRSIWIYLDLFGSRTRGHSYGKGIASSNFGTRWAEGTDGKATASQVLLRRPEAVNPPVSGDTPGTSPDSGCIFMVLVRNGGLLTL